MYWGRILVGAVLVTGLIIGGQAVVGQGNQDRTRGSAGDFTLVIRHCEVHQTNDKADAWDINNGKPDLMVIVRTIPDKDRASTNNRDDNRDRREFKTKQKEDTFSADFNEMVNFGVREGQMIEIEVVDVDVAVNDRIGRIQERISAGAFKEGKRRFENFGRVISLEIEMRKAVDTDRVNK